MYIKLKFKTIDGELIKYYRIDKVCLNLWNKQITKLPAFTSLKNLQMLSLCDNHLTSIFVIAQITNLTDLHLYRNRLTYLPIGQLTKLRVLTLSGNQLTYVPSFINLTKLTFLTLFNNKLKFLPLLSENLEHLDINYNQIICLITNIKNVVINNYDLIYNNDI